MYKHIPETETKNVHAMNIHTDASCHRRQHSLLLLVVVVVFVAVVCCLRGWRNGEVFVGDSAWMIGMGMN